MVVCGVLLGGQSRKSQRDDRPRPPSQPAQPGVSKTIGRVWVGISSVPQSRGILDEIYLMAMPMCRSFYGSITATITAGTKIGDVTAALNIIGDITANGDTLG